MRKYWYISCSASSLQAVYPLPSTIVGARTAQPLAALPPYGCGVPLAGAARPLSRPQAGFPGAAAPAPVGCLSFSCVAKKRTQKKARKGGHPLRRALTRTTTNFKDRQVLRRQHLPVPLCTFRGTHVPNHANVRVVDLHSLPRMFGPLHILLMHHDFLNEQPQQFRRQFLDVGVAPGF